MAKIEVRGYANKGMTKEYSKGQFNVFTLSEAQKDRQGNKVKVYYDVTDFSTGDAVPDGSYVSVEGYLSTRQHNGKTYLNIKATKVDIMPPKERSSQSDAAPPGDGGDDSFAF